jgi:hypothetical protein
MERPWLGVRGVPNENELVREGPACCDGDMECCRLGVGVVILPAPVKFRQEVGLLVDLWTGDSTSTNSRVGLVVGDRIVSRQAWGWQIVD